MGLIQSMAVGRKDITLSRQESRGWYPHPIQVHQTRALIRVYDTSFLPYSTTSGSSSQFGHLLAPPQPLPLLLGIAWDRLIISTIISQSIIYYQRVFIVVVVAPLTRQLR